MPGRAPGPADEPLPAVILEDADAPPPPEAPAAPIAPPAPSLSAKFTVGTLHYTRNTLALMFFWLLWGDFCFRIMETVYPRIMSWYLLAPDRLAVNNKTATLLMTIIPNVFGLMVGPAVSFRSDRYRGRWGRRIPYIMWSMPVLVLALVGLGFSEHFRRYFAGSTLPAALHVSPEVLTVIVIGFFIVVFSFGNEFIDSVFWYLFADVVPPAFLGRFWGLFRVVSTGAGMVFNALMFPFMDTHMHWIFWGTAALYAVGLSMMCWGVKEGQYPPPQDLGPRPSILREVKVYVSECFAHRMYLVIFAFSMCGAAARAASLGGTVFAQQALHVTLAQIGYVAAVTQGVSLALAFPTGWLADYVGPLRLRTYLQLLAVPIQLGLFFFQVDLLTYVIFSGIMLVYGTLVDAADAPLLALLFPRDKFGQFASCNGMMRSVISLVVAPVAAVFMDRMTRDGKFVDGYRWMYIWNAVFYAANCGLLWLVYQMWKHHGGPKDYVPPGSALEAERRAQAAAGGPVIEAEIV